MYDKLKVTVFESIRKTLTVNSAACARGRQVPSRDEMGQNKGVVEAFKLLQVVKHRERSCCDVGVAGTQFDQKPEQASGTSGANAHKHSFALRFYTTVQRSTLLRIVCHGTASKRRSSFPPLNNTFVLRFHLQRHRPVFKLTFNNSILGTLKSWHSRRQGRTPIH